jgi:hypothetical protein
MNKKTLRLKCLRMSSELWKHVNNNPKDKEQIVIETARRFEEFVNEIPDPMIPHSRPVPHSRFMK